MFYHSGHLEWRVGRCSHVEESRMLGSQSPLYWVSSALDTGWTDPATSPALMMCKWTSNYTHIERACEKLAIIIPLQMGIDDIMLVSQSTGEAKLCHTGQQHCWSSRQRPCLHKTSKLENLAICYLCVAMICYRYSTCEQFRLKSKHAIIWSLQLASMRA